MAVEKGTKRARQAIETKKRIIRCAKKMINAKGFDNISVAQISKEAEISIGTFYYYFSTKEDLLYEILPRLSDYSKSSEAIGVAAAPAYTQLMTFFEWLFKFPFDSQREVVKRILFSEQALKAVDEDRLTILEQLIRSGQKNGEFTMTYNSLYIAKMLLYTNRGIFQHYMLNPSEGGYFSAAKDVVGRLAYSYLTEKGRACCPELSTTANTE